MLSGMSSAGAGQAAPVIQIRLARGSPAPGFQAMRAFRADNLYYVSERVLAADHDIECARAYYRPNQLVITINFTPAASARMGEVSREHLGDRVADAGFHGAELSLGVATGGV